MTPEFQRATNPTDLTAEFDNNGHIVDYDPQPALDTWVPESSSDYSFKGGPLDGEVWNLLDASAPTEVLVGSTENPDKYTLSGHVYRIAKTAKK